MTLSNFYRSAEWTGLMTIIKQARLNSDGHNICEHCGKPIVKAYDCIGHHKIELTEDNVNDHMISLNPDNIMLVHHACHNIIHDRLGMSSDKRMVYLVYGSPMAGKSSWVESVKTDGDLIIDMDRIWECISGCPEYVKPPRLKNIAFGVRDYLIDSVRMRRGKWLNAYIIGGYPLISERQRLCQSLGAREVFINTSEEECIARLMDDELRDHEAWLTYIYNWWEKFSPSPSR